MTFFHVVLVLAVVGLVAAVAAGRVRGGLPEPTSTRPDLGLPGERLRPEDVDTVRFSVGLRGYRMDEVDAVLDRLSAELADREREVAELREELRGGPETVQRTGARHAEVEAEPETHVPADGPEPS